MMMTTLTTEQDESIRPGDIRRKSMLSESPLLKNKKLPLALESCQKDPAKYSPERRRGSVQFAISQEKVSMW